MTQTTETLVTVTIAYEPCDVPVCDDRGTVPGAWVHVEGPGLDDSGDIIPAEGTGPDCWLGDLRLPRVLWSELAIAASRAADGDADIIEVEVDPALLREQIEDIRLDAEPPKAIAERLAAALNRTSPEAPYGWSARAWAPAGVATYARVYVSANSRSRRKLGVFEVRGGRHCKYTGKQKKDIRRAASKAGFDVA